jgi:RNA polymerase sigma-70 factor (ECF subfamily)
MDALPTDGELTLAVLAGQRDQFAEIVWRYRGALLRAAESRLKRRDLAEDVVQETFLCAFKSLHTYDSRFSFRTWLWTILLNQCRRRHKRESRRVELLASVSTSNGEMFPQRLASGEAGPPEHAMAREQADRLAVLLDALPEVQADALRLRFFGGLKFHEIAAAMGCSLSSAKARVRLGLTRMSDLMVSGVEERRPT